MTESSLLEIKLEALEQTVVNLQESTKLRQTHPNWNNVKRQCNWSDCPLEDMNPSSEVKT